MSKSLSLNELLGKTNEEIEADAIKKDKEQVLVEQERKQRQDAMTPEQIAWADSEIKRLAEAPID